MANCKFNLFGFASTVLRFLGWSMLICLLPLVTTSGPASAQVTLINGDDEELVKIKTRRAEELSAIEAAIAVSAETLNTLRSETSAIQSDANALSTQLINAAAKVQKIELQVQETEAEISLLSEQEAKLKTKLIARREILSKVLASLQKLGRNPPPALIVQPNDALGAVRSAILMGAVLPEMRHEAEILLADLQSLQNVRADYTSAKEKFTAQIANIKTENARIEFLVKQKRETQKKIGKQIEDERSRAEALAARATSLNELISALENELDAARLAKQQAQAAEEKRQQKETKIALAEDRDRAEKEQYLLDQQAFKNHGRTEPAMAFAQAKGLLPKPVAGLEVKRFGETSELLDQIQGIVISTRPNATIVTPADGWILYAGQYRSFGQIVILNVGDNHNIVLAGLDQTNVAIGQFVISGEPIGRMGDTKLASAANLDIKTNRPALYVEFRQNGKPIDPTPWWAIKETKRENDDS